ncbi:capsid protein [bacterium]|nr:capsid protein [bacterium]
MANGNTSPSRVGLVEGNSDNNELFLKKFSGEILQTFEESNIFKPLHTIRTIDSGKSAQFPVTGIASASYHTPGENIADGGNSYLSDVKKSEKIINIDKMLVASTFLANIDDVKNHYDIRSVYANELGKALAVRFDTAIAKTFLAAARDSANLTTTSAGSTYDVAGEAFGRGSLDPTAVDTFTGAQLVGALFAAAQRLDEQDVPSDGRFCVLRPAEYYKLVTGADASNTFSLTSVINSDIGGQGSIASGNVPQIAGISLYKSNHLPSTDLSGGAGVDAGSSNDVFGGNGVGYDGDFRNTFGIVSHSAAVGTVKLLDLATESEYQIERQGTLFVAKYAMGHGILRPECAIELAS